jgi:acyl dehydratase
MSDLMERLQACVGIESDEPQLARDPVNQPMIRHWCDAIGDDNPVYTEPDFAKQSHFGRIVAPPTMLQAWTMPGLKGHRRAVDPDKPSPLAILDEAGFTSVVATNCEQEYRRYLEPGDLLSLTSTIDSISDEKKTGLGVGHFVTQRMTYRDQNGEIVAEMLFRLLKFRPPA